ncbi:unnamed protein product [Allacma fusca]|uniref:Aldehyde dehydrogenase domain-containing protein n=1 Tax=Allacma fusca TaxID=39272 RepID=A0A8J2KNC5_9HEXA|nr:unnamed protein product [Allacma fusca]
MGCASSGPVKDLAAAATNGATENLKTSLNNTMEDAANLNFEKAQEDLKQVGEDLKDAVVNGVSDLIEDVTGSDKPSLESRQDGDGGSITENVMEESEQAATTEEEPGLDSIRNEEEAEDMTMEEEKEEPPEPETTEEEAPVVVDAGDNGVFVASLDSEYRKTQKRILSRLTYLFCLEFYQKSFARTTKQQKMDSGQEFGNESIIRGYNTRIQKALEETRNAFNDGIPLSFEFRKKQLRNFRRMITECEAEILHAMYKDLRRSPIEGKFGEIKSTLVEIDRMLRHFNKYTADEKIPLNLLALANRAYIRKEPFGVVLIIGSWNVPFVSCYSPLIGAIAAGNTVIVKPSEVVPASADLIAQLIPRYLDKRCYQVVSGDADVARSLLRNKFDYIFFTGSPTVGRSVMQAAALFLTPVTLELGGKNPCYIDKSTNLDRAVKRILWGKLNNGGQICIGPDYILCSKQAKDELTQIAQKYLKDWYGQNPQESPDLVRIVNKQHFNRLKNLLEATKGTIAIGGQMDEDDLWIEPTIVVNVDPETDALMREEMFGPILPIITVNSVDDAIRIMRSRPKPLSMYFFSNDRSVIRKLIETTSSGNICVNDVLWQSVWLGLPFGGVGDSGMGSYRGKATFDTFSHKRSILDASMGHFNEKTFQPRYPPGTNKKLKYFSYTISMFEDCSVPCGRIAFPILLFIFTNYIILPLTSLFGLIKE